MANFCVKETDLVYRQAVTREGKPSKGQVKVVTVRQDIEENNGMTIRGVTLSELACTEPISSQRTNSSEGKASFTDWQKWEMEAVARRVVLIKASHPHRSACRVGTHSGETIILDGTPNYQPAPHGKG